MPDGPIEIACDESGWEGENLVGSNTDVFAHASIAVGSVAAARAVREVRERIRSPATEYKANHLLRRKHRAVLEWTLSPSGPLFGRAHVYLVDKTYLVVHELARVLLGRTTEAGAFYRDGGTALGPPRWHEFLVASNNLLRAKNDGEPAEPVDAFFALLATLPDRSGRAGETVELLRRARPRAEAYRALLAAEPGRVPTLDPLAPAIVRAAGYWSAPGEPVSIVHDRQNTLTDERIDQIGRMFDGVNEPAGRLAGIRLVESGGDPRVQLADFLAGIARKVASDELNGHGDPLLTATLPPYVDSRSLWGDRRSWALVAPSGRAHVN